MKNFFALVFAMMFATAVSASEDGFDTNFDEAETDFPSSSYEGLWIDFSGGAAAGTEGFASGVDVNGDPAGLASVIGQSTSIVRGSVADDSCGDCVDNAAQFSINTEALQQSLSVIEDADGAAANATQSNAAVLGTLDFTRYSEMSMSVGTED